MIFTFDLLNNFDIPVFESTIGTGKVQVPIVFAYDTCASLTTLYMEEERVQINFPGIVDTGESTWIRNANNHITEYRLHKLPELKLKDNQGKTLHIKDLYVVIAGYAMNGIDILLSGFVFKNCSRTIAPVLNEQGTPSTQELLIINTLTPDKDTITMIRHGKVYTGI